MPFIRLIAAVLLVTALWPASRANSALLSIAYSADTHGYHLPCPT